MLPLRHLLLLCISLAACTPSTTFGRIDIAYHPSRSIYDPSDRIVGSAVEARDADVGTLEQADGHYVGELELKGDRGLSIATTNGPANLVGRASIEAAARGATHLVLLSGDKRVESKATESGYDDAIATQVVVAKFALYRVEHDRWRELPEPLRPHSPEPIEVRN
jgi:hypothetical protein